MLSKQLAEHEDNYCYYAEMQELFQSQGININALPPSNVAWIEHAST